MTFALHRPKLTSFEANLAARVRRAERLFQPITVGPSPGGRIDERFNMPQSQELHESRISEQKIATANIYCPEPRMPAWARIS